MSSAISDLTLPEITPLVSKVRLLALTLPVICPLIKIVPVESMCPSIFISLEIYDGVDFEESFIFLSLNYYFL